MPSRKKTKKAYPKKEIAPLYSRDIGVAGLKKKSLSTSSSIIDTAMPLREDEEIRRQQRMARFGIGKKRKDNSSIDEDETSTALNKKRKRNLSKHDTAKHERVVGTSTALEKPYLRLTTFPKSQDVRPLAVLIKSLAHIKSQFIKTEDFDWANEQLKSVRQDITVQGIRNKFVLEVYETHARINLEHGDLQEFNQCQTMIRHLTSNTAENLTKGKEEEDLCLLQQSEEAADEFQAYGVLYSLIQKSWGELTWSLTLGNEFLDTKTIDGERPASLHGSAFCHALAVVKAVVHNDYRCFFRLYESAAPHLSAYLMDFLVRRVRNGAYERIIAAYRPTLSVEQIKELLFFPDLQETRRFLENQGAIFVSENGTPPFWIDCKETFAAYSKKKSRE